MTRRLVKEPGLKLVGDGRGLSVQDSEVRHNGGAGRKSQGIAEDYERGELCVHTHIRRAQTEVHGSDYCIVFQRHIGVHHDAWVPDQTTWGLTKRDADALLHGCRDRQQLVFVRVIKTAEGGEGIRCRLPSLVRLHLLDECPYIRRKTLHPARSARVPPIFGVENGEHRLSVSGVGSGKFPSDEIERGTEIVDGIADCESPGVIRQGRWIDEFDGEGLIGLTLYGNRVRVRTKKALNVLFESIDVLIRPSEFGAATLKCHVAESLYGKDSENS